MTCCHLRYQPTVTARHRCSHNTHRFTSLDIRRLSAECALALIPGKVRIQINGEREAVHAPRWVPALEGESGCRYICEPQCGTRVNGSERIQDTCLDRHLGGDVICTLFGDGEIDLSGIPHNSFHF